jgi:hypothetical protein
VKETVLHIPKKQYASLPLTRTACTRDIAGNLKGAIRKPVSVPRPTDAETGRVLSVLQAPIKIYESVDIVFIL